MKKKSSFWKKRTPRWRKNISDCDLVLVRPVCSTDTERLRLLHRRLDEQYASLASLQREIDRLEKKAADIILQKANRELATLERDIRAAADKARELLSGYDISTSTETD